MELDESLLECHFRHIPKEHGGTFRIYTKKECFENINMKSEGGPSTLAALSDCGRSGLRGFVSPGGGGGKEAEGGEVNVVSQFFFKKNPIFLMELCCFQESEKTAFEIAPLSPEQKELVEALQLRFAIYFNIYYTFF